MDFRTFPEFSLRYPLLLTTFMKRPTTLYPNEIGVVYRNPDNGDYFRFTWLDWYKRTCRLANALRDPLAIRAGKPGQPGDRIATMALNHHRHMELYYAVPCHGAVLHPINIRLSLDNIVHTIKHAEDSVVFFDDSFLPMLEKIYGRIKNTVGKFVYMSDRPGLPDTRIEPLYEYEELIKVQPPEFEWPHLDEDTYATLCYTTGTTGLPKGAMFTHRQLYLMSVHIILREVFNSDPAIPSIEESGVLLLNTPMYHIHGWGYPYLYVFAANKMVLPGRFSPEAFCELAQTEKVTNSGLAPTMVAMLVEYEDIGKYDLSSLKNISVGGAAFPMGLKNKADKLIPGFCLKSGYGMTETAPSTISASVKKSMKDWPRDQLDEVRVKTGLPLPGLEVQVVDEEGVPVPHDDETIGEIVIRGPWIMEQYYNDPERTAEVWRDGWFHTGDAAKVDEHGYVTIVDRVTDVIRSGSEIIPTVLLENLTATADFVLEASYVGVSDPKWGERPMAIVKPAPGSEVAAEDILEFLKTQGVEKGKIAKWMLPDYVAIVDEIPKTSVGKFDKATIKRNLKDFLARAQKTG